MDINLKSKDVIFDHDGGIDDLLSLMLLLTMENINLIGITITPADCYADDAVKSTLKILALCGKSDIPVAVGTLPGPNPFPGDWRAQPRVCHSMPIMLRVEESAENVSALPAHEWLAKTLAEQSSPVTVLMTGPCTNLSWVLKHQPEHCNSIEAVVWMGGAIEVKGNVAMHDHDGSAEWNAYWDPAATKVLVESDMNLLLVPLDATNALPVNRDFLCQLASARTEMSDMAGQFWAATVTAIPAYEFTYFLWDILATAVLGVSDTVYKQQTGKVSVCVTTPSAGQIYQDENSANTIRWLTEVDADALRAYVIKQFTGSFNRNFTENVN